MNDASISTLARERVQRMIDRNIAARVELDSSDKEIADFVSEMDQAEDAVRDFVNAYRNPTVPNPAPIAPEVAAPAPIEEPPVFTDVSSPDLAPSETSGGFAPVIDDAFIVPEIPAPAASE